MFSISSRVASTAATPISLEKILYQKIKNTPGSKSKIGFLGLLFVFLADGRHGIRYSETETAAVDVRRGPQALLFRVRRRGEKLVVVAHLRDEILAVGELAKTAAVRARQLARQLFALVDSEIAEDARARHQLLV